MQPPPLSCFKLPSAPQKESLCRGQALPSPLQHDSCQSAAPRAPAPVASYRWGRLRPRGLLCLALPLNIMFSDPGAGAHLPGAQQAHLAEGPCCVYGSSWFHPQGGHGLPTGQGTVPIRTIRGSYESDSIIWAWALNCWPMRPQPLHGGRRPTRERRAGVGLRDRGHGARWHSRARTRLCPCSVLALQMGELTDTVCLVTHTKNQSNIFLRKVQKR